MQASQTECVTKRGLVSGTASPVQRFLSPLPQDGSHAGGGEGALPQQPPALEAAALTDGASRTLAGVTCVSSSILALRTFSQPAVWRRSARGGCAPPPVQPRPLPDGADAKPKGGR